MSSGFHYCGRCDDAFGPSHFVCKKEAREKCASCAAKDEKIADQARNIANLKAAIVEQDKLRADARLLADYVNGLYRTAPRLTRGSWDSVKDAARRNTGKEIE